ncbi:MAG TPA: DUF222 domain-containing protein [Streptosporangiaceae bacterium]
MTQVITVTVPASASDAMDMVHAGLAYLATVDATAMGAAAQAACLRGLEQANSVATAVRVSVLGAFVAGQGYTDDGAFSPRAWLVHQTAITVGAASGHTGWVKRARAHPRVQAALAAKEISEPWARVICAWTAELPEGSRDAADGILLAGAVSGLGLPDLAALAGEMYERSRQHAPGGDGPSPGQDQDADHDPGPCQSREDGGDQDRDPAEGGQAGEPADAGEDRDLGEDAVLDDRSVRLAMTFGGAGVIRGDLTPECAQVVRAVLDALSARADAEDTRSHEQRYHDALQEAMSRLVAAGLVPQRAGQPVKVLAHVTLADLMLLEGSEGLREEWTRQARARWAGYKARNAGASGGDGAWLDGDAAAAIACDAMVVPVVTGQVNPAVFADLVRLCAALDKLSRRGDIGAAAAGSDREGGLGSEDAAAAGTVISQEALEQAIIGKAVDLLSGPGGLASFVRQRQLGEKLAGPSLPLDIGISKTIPAGIRNLVHLRDRHCRFPGCRRPAAVCEVHHIRHKAHGGKTSVTNCVLLCRYHHQIAIHRQGWTLVLNPDGTTTAWNKDKTKVLHSHGPPARAG